MFGRRPDATPVRNLSTLRRFMPFISPRRSESLVLFDTEIEVDAALRFLAARNRGVPRDQRTTLFHLLLHAISRALHTRPNMNRFTAGGRLWQRKGVWITFCAKQELRDESPILTVKREFPPDETLDDIVTGVRERLTARRGGERSGADREMSLALYLPAFVIRLGVLALRAANSIGLLPRAMIDDDPLFASVFVANLGSVGLDAGYHHLWEYGTCPIFAVLGRVRRREDGKRVVHVKYSFDERVEDGLYAAISLQGVKDCLESPEQLTACPPPPSSDPEELA